MKDHVEENIKTLQPELVRYMNRIGHRLTGDIPYKGDPVVLATYLRSLFTKGTRYTWNKDGVSIGLGVSSMTIITEDWHAQIGFSMVTGEPMVRIIGMEPEPAVEALQDSVTDSPFGEAMAEAIATEYERLRTPYSRTPIPGKKRARTTIAPDQTEAGDHTGKPVFGSPETGKKRKAKK